MGDIKSSKLGSFVEGFNSTFGEVLDSVYAYEEYYVVGDAEIPDFAGEVEFVDINSLPGKRVVYHDSLDTDFVDTEAEAVDGVIDKIKKFKESVIPENCDSKHYKLFWRVRPEIRHEKDFDLMKDIYRSWARLSIVERE